MTADVVAIGFGDAVVAGDVEAGGSTARASAAPVGVKDAETISLGCSLSAAMDGFDTGPASFGFKTEKPRHCVLILTWMTLLKPRQCQYTCHYISFMMSLCSPNSTKLTAAPFPMISITAPRSITAAKVSIK